MKRLSTHERRLAIGGLISFGFSALPWLGAGHGTFVEPFGHHLLPRLKILPPNGLGLYDLAELPLHLLTLVPGFEYAIHFSGEGRAVVRPFVFFLFWACVSSAFVWAGVRRRVLGQSSSAEK